jgi:hypothetical protein
MVPDAAERARIMPNTVRYFRHLLINLEGATHVRMPTSGVPTPVRIFYRC